MKYILLDIGSSTIKAYTYSNNKLTELKQKSIHFKKNFTKKDLGKDDKQELINFVLGLQKYHPKTIIKTYATSIFRKLSTEAKEDLIETLFSKTGVLLNIIDQTTESIYLQIALTGKYKTRKNIMLINIGGGSAELVILKNNLPIERKNIKLGVGTINSMFPEINEQISKVRLDKITATVKKQLSALQNKCDTAFYTGGELRYMQLAKYPLKSNKLFRDKEHPSIITLNTFAEKNEKIFEETKLKDLENLMPENPKWMHGARGCSALAQAICDKYNIKTIIPSNSNLMHGVVRYEFGD